MFLRQRVSLYLKFKTINLYRIPTRSINYTMTGLSQESKQMNPTSEPDLKKVKIDVENESKPVRTTAPRQKQQIKKQKIRKYKAKKIDETSPTGVLHKEIQELLHDSNLTEEDVTNDVPFILNCEDRELLDSKYHSIVKNVKILRFTSNGDGLGLIDTPFENKKHRIVAIPFAIPGDLVNIKVFKTLPLYCEGDLLEVVEKSEMRHDELIQCKKYFGKCSGCQYQNIEYETQLSLKRQTIENAYKFFASSVSATCKHDYRSHVKDTVGSPLQYDYRTKLTPHFDIAYGLSKKLRRAAHNDSTTNTTSPAIEFERPNLGFGSKGKPTWRDFPDSVLNCRGSVLDIEECVIGTKAVQDGFKRERAKYLENYQTYKKGATILLREDTDPANNSIKTCVTDQRKIIVEIVNGKKFEFIAGEFFQNNNSILPLVIEHVNQNLVIPNVTTRYLVDAYCGSGLFSISCSDNVDKVIGVEISQEAVKFAEINSKINNIENCKFVVGEAQKIFQEIDTPCDQTSVILDPPRKGCDEVFLNQLSEYKPAKIVYISCNVHSQARDVDWFLNKTDNGHLYEVVSITGFDFFPQTHHVESVCVLSRV